MAELRKQRTKPMTTVRKYVVKRIRTLKPANGLPDTHSPWYMFKLLSTKNWLFFLVAFFAWTWDAFDFFSVTLVITDLARDFGKSQADITLSLTLVLIFRSLGAAIFGIAADRYGRKRPFIVNNMLLIILELATGFCRTYKQFLACRALFGLAMGGIYGNTAATALEDCPKQSRGLISGILQSGYSLGYLLATIFARALVDTTSHGWRPLFWFGACPPLLVIIFRLCLPETDAYLERVAVRNEREDIGGFVWECREAVRRHWRLLIYLVLLLTGFSFMSHGSQDLYPTMMRNKYNFSSEKITRVQVVANLGAIIGGCTLGYCSQIIGRRFSIIAMCILGCTLLYPYSFTSGPGIYAAVFFEQFCVQGAFGVIPVHLVELSPPSFRTFVVGTSYQLGVTIASPADYIEARIGERFPLPSVEEDGVTTQIYDYSRVIAIFMSCAYVYNIFLTALGPEKRGRDMGADDDDDSSGEEDEEDGSGMELEEMMNHGKY